MCSKIQCVDNNKTTSRSLRKEVIQNLIDVTGIRDLDDGTFVESLFRDQNIDVSNALNLILTELQKRDIQV